MRTPEVTIGRDSVSAFGDLAAAAPSAGLRRQGVQGLLRWESCLLGRSLEKACLLRGQLQAYGLHE